VSASIFEFDDYKAFVHAFIEALPQRGRGQYRQMARHMRVHTTLLSHVFRGDKELTCEQACSLASFLALPELDADYLLALVERNRAGSSELKSAVGRRLTALRERRQQIEHRVPGARTLSDVERATFYSQWYYSGIRLAASLPGMTDADTLSERLGLPRELVQLALGFLLDAGLLAREADGYRLLSKRTHLGPSSPFAVAHHKNWRLKAISRYDSMSASDFAFTSPIALAREDFAAVRALLVDAVADVARRVEPSSCECLALLNIDWLEL
jgi:uncharacterized protein (TIGR02147 family)